MLENILKIKGVQKLEGKTQKNIKGGLFNTGDICPSEGEYCAVNGGVWFGVRCLSGPAPLCCVQNKWQFCTDV